jgi:hypothetical protein
LTSRPEPWITRLARCSRRAGPRAGRRVPCPP